MPADPPTIDQRLSGLIRRAQQGDLQAFEEVVIACSRQVRLFIFARALHPSAVEEAVQAAFVTAFERLRDYQPTGSFTRWVCGIAWNHLRQERRRLRRAGQPIDDLLLQLTAPEEPAEPDPLIDAHSLRLPECLAQLSPAGQALLSARYHEGLTLEEIAERSGKTANALAVALHRLRHTLRSCLEQHQPEAGR